MSKYKAVSCFLYLYGGIGFTILFLFDFSNISNMVCGAVLYAAIPLYSAYGIWRRKRSAIMLAFLPFLAQSIRYIGHDATFFNISPITVSFPLTSFEQGTGYLIDYLAITMLCILIYLLRDNVNRSSR